MQFEYFATYRQPPRGHFCHPIQKSPEAGYILFATLITKNIGKEEEEKKKRSGEET